MDATRLALLRRVGDSLSTSWHVVRLIVESPGATYEITVAPLRYAPPPPAPEPVAPTTGCRADILQVLRAAGQRLTAAEILSEMLRRGMEWSERSVKRYLAEMLAEHVVDNIQPDGYGLVPTECQAGAN